MLKAEVSVQKYDGGYTVMINGNTQVVTSLSKVVKLVRDALSENESATNEKEEE